MKAKVHYPEFWAKQKKHLSPEFIESLEETANREPTASDEYGEYKPGTFLHKSTIVTVTQEDNLWSIHIVSKHPISALLVSEIRYKFLPDDVMMAQLFGSREETKMLKGVVLYQIPNQNQAEEASECTISE